MSEIRTVYLQRCASYERERLKEFFQLCFRDTGYTLRSSHIMVKPNLISSAGTGLACTNPQFLLALVEFLLDSGARVGVGDSPAFGTSSAVLAALGVDGELAKREVRIIDFITASRHRLPCGVNIRVAAEPLACDCFVNAPKIKAHSQMYVTMAVKNLFGIVQGMEKPLLHMRHGGEGGAFSAIILDLVSLLPPHCSVIDGVVAMHREGPLLGEPLDLGCLGFSNDPVALDTALLHALELDPGRSPLWQEARRRKLPGVKKESIFFPLLKPRDFRSSYFQAPLELAPIRFSPWRFLRGSLTRLGRKVVNARES